MLRLAPPPPPRAILRGVNVALRRGDLLAVIGPSGCGKARVLRVSCCLSSC
jgi:ABC-type protease/lipase transport system fused ATPase/permease subunit